MAIVNSFEALGVVFCIKKRSPQPDWAKSRQEKFLKCPKCGAQMKRINGTNVLLCEGTIETEGFNENGASFVKKEPCNFTRLLDKESVSYAEYLFS